MRELWEEEEECRSNGGSSRKEEGVNDEGVMGRGGRGM